MTTHKQAFGKEGEEIALAYLIKKKYKILAKNYRSGRAEIDIIASKDDVFIFVEVKIRATAEYGQPEDAVTSHKMGMMAQGAEDFLIDKNLDGNCRYDIISIVKNQYKTELHHFEDAFWPGLY